MLSLLFFFLEKRNGGKNLNGQTEISQKLVVCFFILFYSVHLINFVFYLVYGLFNLRPIPCLALNEGGCQCLHEHLFSGRGFGGGSMANFTKQLKQRHLPTRFFLALSSHWSPEKIICWSLGYVDSLRVRIARYNCGYRGNLAPWVPSINGILAITKTMFLSVCIYVYRDL